jgi:glycolate oxidase subunit GlcD
MPPGRPRPPRDDELVRRLRRAVGRDALLDHPASCAVYARDASHLRHGQPLCVVLPASAEQLRRVIELCAQDRRAFVVRGGGTGLSGGALPSDGAVVIATSRLVRLGPVDPDRRRVYAEPGVLNATVGRHAAADGLRFAPDPSSEAAATIGGNVAENAGGPHGLKLGVTVRHVRRLDWVDPEGREWTTGRGSVLDRGIGLRGLLCGSEGTLGVVVGADLELVPAPEAAVAMLAEFPRLHEATGAVVALLHAGVVPEACEIIDRVMLDAVESAYAAGFAPDVEAVMIVEVGGVAGAVAEDAERTEEVLRRSGAREIRRADDAQARHRLWESRKGAFGAVGRLAPAYVSTDIVCPLAALPTLVADIGAITAEHGVRAATAFHAGDGNLHPGIPYDPRDEDARRRARAASVAIGRRAIALGGSCTGEHGIGLEKRDLAAEQLDPVALRLMHAIKDLCDPAGICNPGKALPGPGIGRRTARPVPDRVAFAWDDLTVTAPASTPLAELQAEALARGLWIPIGGASRSAPASAGLAGAQTVGDVLAAGAAIPPLLGEMRAADAVLELWARTGSGDVLHAGAPVRKNVAGYDLARLLVGSGDLLAVPLAATLQLAPAPEAVGVWSWPDAPPSLTGEGRRDFMRVLRRHPGAALAVRERTDGGPSLWVLASGRDRPWDLGRLELDLAAWSEDHGVGRPTFACRPGSALASGDLLAGLPAWAQAAPDWTLLSLREGKPDWPRPRCLIWINRPEMLWIPEALPDEPVGWMADLVYHEGRLMPPPVPTSGVPRHLLAGIKRLLDPGGSLPCPDWLATALLEAPA